MNTLEKLAIEHGAVHYSPPPMRAVKGLSFTFEQLEAFAKALQQSSEPVAGAVYEIYNGLGNWREVSKSEYDDWKRTKRALVTANANDFCYEELKAIYDEMYTHKDIARVANQLYKLIHSRTHPPATVPIEWEKLKDPNVLHTNLLRGFPAKLSDEQLLHLLGSEHEVNKRVPLEKYNKLLEALKEIKGINAQGQDAILMQDIAEQAIAEAEGK